MLTVKYINPDGINTVFEAHEVVMAPSERVSGAIGHVSFVRPKSPSDNGNLVQVSCGTVYVMNQYGKTVATYEMEDGRKLPARTATWSACTIDTAP